MTAFERSSGGLLRVELSHTKQKKTTVTPKHQVVFH